jgi:branched-chain amino acid transport system ATP-binding protein
MTKLLDVHQLKVHYGGVNAVKGISFHLNAGEIVALVGANGAGKSSTLRAVCKLATHSGKVLFDNQDLATVKSHDLVRLGIALVPEGRGIFSNSTVEENLLMGAYIYRDAQVSSDLKKIYTLFPRLQERNAQAAGTLSGGEQQMLALGRALMSRPKLLLLDEPSMGLAPLVVKAIFAVLKQIAADGMTILLVEQNAALALELSMRGYVMESGKIVLTDSATALLENPQIRAAYLGQ